VYVDAFVNIVGVKNCESAIDMDLLNNNKGPMARSSRLAQDCKQALESHHLVRSL
jgi:hypothetical protein